MGGSKKVLIWGMDERRTPGDREARQQALARLSRLVSSSLDLDEVLPAIARAAAELMGIPAVSFWIVNERERRLDACAFSDPAVYGDFPQTSATFDQGGVGWIATHQQPLEVPDVFADPRFFRRDWWRSHGLTSFLGTPIFLGDRLLAVLAMVSRTPFRLTPEDRELLEAFAAQAAVAIRNAQLFADSERRRRVAQDLADLSRLLSETLDIGRVAQAVADGIRQRLGALSTAVYSLEPRTGALVALATAGPEATFAWTRVLPLGNGAAGLAVERRVAVATPDALCDVRIRYEPEARAQLERSDYRAVLAVPFLVQDRVIGALAVGDRAGRAFEAEEVELARAFATQAAVALESARLLDESELRRQAAEEAESRYRGLFEGVPVGLYRITADGRFLDANPALVHMFGYPSREAFLGVNPLTLYADPEDRARWRTLLEREGVVRDFELRLRRLDGRLIWVRRSARIVRDAAGAPLYYEGIQEDITERKRAEEAERQAAALRSVAQLANAAAHEINNPLLVITGRLELLARRFHDDDGMRTGLEQAVAAGRRITEIIARMGRITRLEIVQQSPGLAPILDLRRSGEEEPPAQRSR
jgi:PAS domain S-box-containing protein